MLNKRFITGVIVAACLAVSNIVLGAGAASAYSGYITQADCDSFVLGYNTEINDSPGYMTVQAKADSGETKQLYSSFVAPGNSVEDVTVQFSELPGTGPYDISLTFYDGETITELDSVAVSACVSAKPTVTPLTGTCQVQVTPAGAVVNFALASGKPATRSVNSTLFTTSQTTATYTLDVVGSPSKTELRSGFSLKAQVNGTSFTFKVSGTC